MKRISFALALIVLLPFSAGAAFSRDLSVDSRGDDVKALQEFLAKDPALYPEGAVTGYFGALTRAAVRRLQEREKIAPAEGYVGPKTRSRLNQLIDGSSDSREAEILRLTAKLQELQALLLLLQSSQATTTATTPPAGDTTPPAILSAPVANVGTLASSSPFGVGVSVPVTITWTSDDAAASSFVTCTPALRGVVDGVYWAEASGTHQCTLTLEDASRNVAATPFSFEVPGWVAVSGSGSALLSEQSTKLGNIEVADMSSTTLTVFRVEVMVEDALDAPNSRGKNYKLTLRDGETNGDPLLTKLDVYLHSVQPRVGEFHSHHESLYAGVSLLPSAKKNFSLWVEGLTGPLYGGYLSFTVTSISTIPEVPIVGEADFRVSR